MSGGLLGCVAPESSLAAMRSGGSLLRIAVNPGSEQHQSEKRFCLNSDRPGSIGPVLRLVARPIDLPRLICILSGSPRRPIAMSHHAAPSSRGLGHGPFKAATRVRIPSGSLAFFASHSMQRRAPEFRGFLFLWPAFSKQSEETAAHVSQLGKTVFLQWDEVGRH